MRINITNTCMSLQDFKEIFNGSTNIKDVHLLCHQAGCPVYIVRANDEGCIIFWHPELDIHKNTINFIVEDNILRFIYDESEYNFMSVRDLRQDTLVNHMLGDNPFDDNFCVWKR